MGDDLVSIERRDGEGRSTIRVVPRSRLAAEEAEGWVELPEGGKIDGGRRYFNVQQPLYNDMIMSIQEADTGKRIPLSGTRKQQLGEAQRQIDKRYGEGRFTAEF